MMQQFALMGLKSLSAFLHENLKKEADKTSDELFADASIVHDAMYETGSAKLAELGYTSEPVGDDGITGTAGDMLCLLYIGHATTVFKSHLPDEGNEDSVLDDLLGGLDDDDTAVN